MYSNAYPFADPMKGTRKNRVIEGVLAASLAAGCTVSAGAQDAGTEPTPELKDFRLDPAPKAEPAPLPTSAPNLDPVPAPKVDSPPAVQAAPRAESRAAQRSTERTQPRRDEPDAVQAPAKEPLPAETADTAPVDTAKAPVVDAKPSEAPAPKNTTPGDAMRFWPILLSLLAALLGWLGYRQWRSQTAMELPPETEPVQPVDVAEPIPTDEPQPDPVVVPAASRRQQPESALNQGALTASFEPADARLSLANLTITGCLRLHYEGKKPLAALRLRNQVISACEGQQVMINAFHNDPEAGRIDSLGSVQPGEEIVLTLELQVPRDGLQAFDWRQRLFVAPILLLNLESEDGSVEPSRINCLVGLEGDPASPKMRPLPIDRGPKHFAALRFRPLPA
ncbi:MAG: hypothetical protein RL481_304 [Pseudomonadota bacterium]